MKTPASKILLAALALSLSCAWSQGPIAQPSAEPQQPDAVRFKPEGSDTGGLALRVVGGLVVAALLACGAIFALKRFAPWIAVPGTQPGKGNVRVVEVLRVTQKLSLFVVEFGADRILLAQTDHGVTVVSNSSLSDAPRGRSETA